MNLPEQLDRPFRRLFDYYVRRDETEAAQMQSGQSGLQADLEARQKLARHPPLAVRACYAGGGQSAVLWYDDGIRNGLVYVGQGDEFPEEARTFRVHDRPQRARPDAVAGALDALDEHMRRVLELLARDPLPIWRTHFGKPFKSEGGERFRAPTLGVMKEPARGPGNLAHLTATAAALWSDRAQWRVDELGRTLQARTHATATDRKLARVIEREACDLAFAALRTFADALRSASRLPVAVERAGAAA